jgi:hypothetical protein
MVTAQLQYGIIISNPVHTLLTTDTMMQRFLAITSVAMLMTPATSFVLHMPTPIRQSSAISSTPADSTDLFKSEGWKPIEADLNKLPVFTVANQEGKPLAYTVETTDNSYTTPFFYVDIDDALEELQKAKDNTGLEGLDLVPYPMGQAFQLWASDQAVIVPSKESVLQAGAPPGSNPIGQQVPLFACMDICQETEDGRGVLPLFMVLEEANFAMEQALKADGGNMDDFEVVSLSLSRAVEMLATVPESPAFQFIPPSSSVKYIQEYLSG